MDFRAEATCGCGWSASLNGFDEVEKAYAMHKAECDGPHTLTDDQLRAECERRGMAVSGPGKTEETWNSVRRERDEWKRRAEAADQKIQRLCAQLDTLQDVAFKREAMRPLPPIVITNTTADQMARATHAQGLKGLAAFIRPTTAEVECGPGIARLPERDNSVAFLDEDLLADDA